MTRCSTILRLVPVALMLAWQTGCGGEECTPTDEICNGVDDDCNGVVDDYLTLEGCQTVAGEAGVKECIDGGWTACIADGRCAPGQTRDCSSACGGGTQVCIGDQWSDCDAPQPQLEICNGLDDDCDGVPDNGYDCTPGTSEVCGSDVGICSTGTRTCSSQCTWGLCEGSIEPGTELCSPVGLDENCNGTVDEGCACVPDETQDCCGGTQLVCGSDGQWAPAECPPTPAETCNGVDENCNGEIDDGLPQDAFEPNDQCTAAAVIASAVVSNDAPHTITANLYHPDLTEDHDYYAVTADESSSFLYFDEQCLNFTVELYEPAGVDLEFCLMEDICSPAKWCSDDEGNDSNSLILEWPGWGGDDDGAYFLVEVRSRDGSPVSSCMDYTLTFTFEKWDEACL